MKTTVLALAMVLLLTGASLAQGKLSVVVKNVKDTQGQVRVGLFKDDKTFLKKAWKGEVVKAATGELRVVFENIPAGTYAISIIHDENENGELDSNFFGIPKEGFGFSNDAMGSFGPPDFAKASFSLNAAELQVAVSMRYM
ncbi:MAG: DUF2141 domain-containing protein [Bacteroidota bacterium]